MSEQIKLKRALISVSDKTGIAEIAKTLQENGVEIISSGGTGKHFDTHNINWTPIEEITGNPEAFGGRMKTLSFQVASGLLFRRNHEKDEAEAKHLNIRPIDLVICNLYPFEKTAKETKDLEKLIDNIDIGGPTMIRAGAKNFKDVCVCVNPNEYDSLINEIKNNGGKVSYELRKKMALRAFRHTAEYDALIAKTLGNVLEDDISSSPLFLAANKGENLRYGENPHQWAKVIKDPTLDNNLASALPLQGKKLSYNNYIDADAAYRCCNDLNTLFSDKFISVIIKHANPCGAAVGNSSLNSLKNAWKGDPVSSFGSIICFNKEVDEKTADFFNDKFIEVILAPSFSSKAKEIFAKKKNLRLLEISPKESMRNEVMIRSISGGWVIQEEDSLFDVEFEQVTTGSKIEKNELAKFGSVVTKHLKSNAISLVCETLDGFMLAGGGMGNPNRLVSITQAVEKAQENKINPEDCLLVSDAFFPFKDNIELIKGFGITKVIQPGGSIKDKEVIAACEDLKVSMSFTGRRHFRH